MNIKSAFYLGWFGDDAGGCSQDSDTNETNPSFSTIQGLASAGGGIKGRIAWHRLKQAPIEQQFSTAWFTQRQKAVSLPSLMLSN